MTEPRADQQIVPQRAAIEIVRATASVTVIAVEGADIAPQVAAAMRSRIGGATRVEDLAAAWRAGVAVAGEARLSAAIVSVIERRATIIHAGDLAVHAIAAGRAWLVAEPHSSLLADSPRALRVRTRGINLPPPADRAQLAELDLGEATHLAITSVSVWAPLAGDFAARLAAPVSDQRAVELVAKATATTTAVAKAVARVPRACAIIALPPPLADALPGTVEVAAQRRARRAVRARLASMIGARAVVLAGEPGSGKTTVLEQLARRGTLDASGTLVRAAAVRRAAKARAPLAEPGQTVLVDRLADVVAGEAAIADALADAIRDGLALVTTATRDELAALATTSPRLHGLLQIVELGAPTDHEVLAVARAWAPRFASRHRARIEPAAITAAAQLAARYRLGRAQPEAALFVLEQACVRAGDAPIVSCSTAGRGSGIVDRAAVVAAVADQAGIAIDLVDSDPAARAAQLADRLAGRLHGQREATDRVAAAVLAGLERRAREQPRRPLASLLLLGPTGTGKTETARLLAEAWFCDPRALTVVDLSEYRDPASVTRLVGASPGYVGYGHKPSLAASLAARPHQVVLFDELEKACVEVQLLLLQILDEGQLARGTAGAVDFRDAIVVLTSNLMTDGDDVVGFLAAARQPVASREARTRAALERELRPELVGRIDAIVRYAPLSAATARLVALGHLGRSADAMIATGRLAAAELPALRKQVLGELAGGEIRGGAREVMRIVDRILAEHRTRATPPSRAGLTVVCDYHDGGRERFAAGFVVELRAGADPDEVATAILTHPAATSLLYVAHDPRRVLAIVGDEARATELAAAHAAHGETRCATGRITVDVARRVVGDLVDRLLGIA